MWNKRPQEEFRGSRTCACTNDQVKQLLNWDPVADLLFQGVQQHELNYATNPSSVYMLAKDIS